MRGRRAIGEDVTQVRIAACTQNLDPHHAVAGVAPRRDVFVGDRLEKAGPAGARLELGQRRKQGQPAADARVNAVALVVEQGATEGSLGTMGAGHTELLGGEPGPPLGLCPLDARDLERAHQLPLCVEHFDRNG